MGVGVIIAKKTRPNPSGVIYGSRGLTEGIPPDPQPNPTDPKGVADLVGWYLISELRLDVP